MKMGWSAPLGPSAPGFVRGFGAAWGMGYGAWGMGHNVLESDVPDLLRDALAQSLPEYDTIDLQESDLSQIVPTEYRADMVVVLRAGGRPVYGIVVEVQLTRDEDKRFKWPVYGNVLRARLRCPCCLLVVTPDAAIARWAAKPIETGQPSSPFTPLVLGPEATPVVTDVALARQAPELALLSVQAHGMTQHGYGVGRAALLAADGLDAETSVLYFDLIQLAVSEAIRRQLERLMNIENYEFRSDFAKKYLAKGRAEGRAEGQAEGRAEGQAEGRTEGQAKALLRVLAARGLEVSESHRARILQCGDSNVLDRWLDRAVAIDSVDEIIQGV